MTKTFVLQSAGNKDFKVDYKKELNNEQYQVVTEAEGPCLVLAGAGSGKTRTIVYRVAYLIERGVNPENILLVTFTNKAAREMLLRVEQLLGQAPAGLWGGTFHHIGNRILRKYAAKLGYQPNFTILDEEDSKDLIKVCLKEEDIDLKARRFPSPAVIKDLLSYVRNSQGDLEEVINLRHPKWLKIADKIKKISLKYEQKKQSANSMDFDDLLVNWLKLLRNFPEVKDRLATQFNYILVDEYQDTNYLQAEVVKELAGVHHNVLVVGDDAQSIYSFRAADIGNILNFPKIFTGAKIFRLETNYRSTPEILKLANGVIENNREQFPKVLKPVLASFVKPNVVPAASGSQEAKYIVEQILQLNSEGVPFNKMAVLFRAAFHSQELEFELTKKDIAYEYRGGVRFFERSHVKDVLAFLKVINNPADEVAWHRILNLQTGIGEVTAARIYQSLKTAKDIAEVLSFNLDDVLTPKAELGWQSLVHIFNKLKGADKNLKIEELIRTVIKSNYKDYLEAEYPNFQERLDDLEQLAVFSEKYDDLNVFLSEMSLQESFSASAKAPADKGEQLILSTIHQAKGLEWQAVFIINLTDNSFPNNRALAEDGGLEEERRLFYVAITRAQKQLFLTYPIIASRASMYLNSPSQFLTEINANLLEEVKLIEKTIWNRKDLNDGNVSYLPDLDSL
ncbi:MAG: ATP-dependent helicase [Candidatus Komeilibacteria bacterium]|nr:ATP-dependent helicase [Candidatus Komeilibacteria bacterium]